MGLLKYSIRDVCWDWFSKSCCMLVSVSPLSSTTGGGGVANLTLPPFRCGTCRESRFGRVFWVCGLLGGKDGSDLPPPGKKLGISESATIGVAVGVSPMEPGLAGNVENGPSITERLLGGLPRSFPAEALPLLGHADDTAGPWRRLDRDLFGVVAD